MIDVYKHAATYDKAALSLSMTFSNRPSRKHGYQIRRVEAGDGKRGKQRNSFYYRTPATWNDLPRHVVEAKSVNAFKEGIDTYWKEDQNRFNFNSVPYQNTEIIE